MEKFKTLCLLLTLFPIELANGIEQNYSSANDPAPHANPTMKEETEREEYTIPVTLGIAGMMAAQHETKSLVVVYPDGYKQETSLQNNLWRTNRFNLRSVDASGLSSGIFSIYYTSLYLPGTPISLTECVFEPALDLTKRITKIRIHVSSEITLGPNGIAHSCVAELAY